MTAEKYKIYNKSCYGLNELTDNSIDSLITDPPYGISYQNNYWDKDLPNIQFWKDCYRVLKNGSYGLVFSSVRLMHRLMVDLEDSGFIIHDILFWAYLNGMPKSRDIALDIDKELNVESKVVGKYNYVQGYRKNGADNYYAEKQKLKFEPASEPGIYYKGAGIGLKPAYEPIIFIQKPNKADRDNSVEFNYKKLYMIAKVRQNAEEYNHHPTLKPVELMEQLVKNFTQREQIILDPFMGSGSTGIACLNYYRKFVGYELDNEYFKICEKRFGLKNN